MIRETYFIDGTHGAVFGVCDKPVGPAQPAQLRKTRLTGIRTRNVGVLDEMEKP